MSRADRLLAVQSNVDAAVQQIQALQARMQAKNTSGAVVDAVPRPPRHLRGASSVSSHADMQTPTDVDSSLWTPKEPTPPPKRPNPITFSTPVKAADASPTPKSGVSSDKPSKRGGSVTPSHRKRLAIQTIVMLWVKRLAEAVTTTDVVLQRRMLQHLGKYYFTSQLGVVKHWMGLVLATVIGVTNGAGLPSTSHSLFRASDDACNDDNCIPASLVNGSDAGNALMDQLQLLLEVLQASSRRTSVSTVVNTGPPIADQIVSPIMVGKPPRDGSPEVCDVCSVLAGLLDVLVGQTLARNSDAAAAMQQLYHSRIDALPLPSTKLHVPPALLAQQTNEKLERSFNAASLQGMTVAALLHVICRAVFECHSDIDASSTNYRLSLLKDMVSSIVQLLRRCDERVCRCRDNDEAFSIRLSQIDAAIQKRVAMSAVCADLQAGVGHRNKFDIEATLAVAHALSVNVVFPDLVSHAEAALHYLKQLDVLTGRVKQALRTLDTKQLLSTSERGKQLLAETPYDLSQSPTLAEVSLRNLCSQADKYRLCIRALKQATDSDDVPGLLDAIESASAAAMAPHPPLPTSCGALQRAHGKLSQLQESKVDKSPVLVATPSSANIPLEYSLTTRLDNSEDGDEIPVLTTLLLSGPIGDVNTLSSDELEQNISASTPAVVPPPAPDRVVRIKCHCTGDDTRLLLVSSNTAWSRIKAKLQAKFDMPLARLRWKDADGDMIAILNKDDWELVLRLSPHTDSEILVELFGDAGSGPDPFVKLPRAMSEGPRRGGGFVGGRVKLPSHGRRVVSGNASDGGPDGLFVSPAHTSLDSEDSSHSSDDGGAVGKGLPVRRRPVRPQRLPRPKSEPAVNVGSGSDNMFVLQGAALK